MPLTCPPRPPHRVPLGGPASPTRGVAALPTGSSPPGRGFQRLGRPGLLISRFHPCLAHRAPARDVARNAALWCGRFGGGLTLAVPVKPTRWGCGFWRPARARLGRARRAGAERDRALLSPTQLRSGLPGPILLGPVLLGPVLLGPVLLGPVLLGPVLLGPVLLGPVLLGPVLLGPVLLGPIPLGPVLSSPALFGPALFSSELAGRAPSNCAWRDRNLRRVRRAAPVGSRGGRLHLLDSPAFALGQGPGVAETRENAPHIRWFDRACRAPLLLDGNPEPGDEPHPFVRAQGAVRRIRSAAQIVEHDLLAARAHAPIVPESAMVIAAERRSTVNRVNGNGRDPGGGAFETWLRERSDAELAALFAARPDLVTPVPAGIDALASRAARRLSLERALDDLDRFSLQVLEVLLALPSPVPADRLEQVLGTPAVPLGRCLAALRARALTWHTGGGFRPSPGLRAVISEPRVPAGPAGSHPSRRHSMGSLTACARWTRRRPLRR